MRVSRSKGDGRRFGARYGSMALLAAAALIAGCASSDGASSDYGLSEHASMPASTRFEGSGSSGASVPQQAGLRAGSVDDNQNFDDYLAYRSRVRDLGVASRDIDPTGRTILKVIGRDGLPAVGARVTVARNGRKVTSLTTTADGTVRFMPRAYGDDSSGDAVAEVDGARVILQPGASQQVELAAASAPSGRPKLDVLFLLDTTGSMGDEIDRLKTTIDSIARRVGGLDGSPDVRFGMTIYRDTGDAYLTRTFDLTADASAFRSALAKVSAAGGGDTPEALDEALAAAIAEPSWHADAMKLIFLVADAGPHIERQVASPYTESVRAAADRGIKIFPVASSNSDDRAEVVFRQIAQFTGARFVFLSYGAGGAALGAGTDIDTTDYEELALDDLVVRLIAEELAARTGTAVSLPKPQSTTTTNPRGQ